MSSRKKRFQLNILLYAFVGFLLLYGAFATFRTLRQSFILDSRDRVNVIFYGEKPLFLSFGLTDEVNYIMAPRHDLLMQAPGGYGQYPTGSLGRLSDIEQKPELIQRAFSSTISGYVDYYIAPEKNVIYKDLEDSEIQFKKIELIRQIFSPQSQSNMNIFDKLYVFFKLSKKRQSDFVVLKPVEKPDKKEEDTVAFYEKGFQKKYKGFFFHQSLREEGLSLKMLYYSDTAAVVLSRVIEGEGIRVVDLAKLDEARKERCIIQHNLENKTKTVQFLSKQFNCRIEKGEVEGSDIIMVLGSELEQEWK